MPKDEVKQRAEGWVYTCSGCGFRSGRWRTRALADERRKAHEEEHAGGDPQDPPRNEKE